MPRLSCTVWTFPKVYLSVPRFVDVDDVHRSVDVDDATVRNARSGFQWLVFREGRRRRYSPSAGG
jgi:hypothetical protein